MINVQTDFVTTKEAAIIIGKSDSWMRQARQHRFVGPPWFKIGGRIFYLKKDLVEFIEGSRHE